MNRVLRVVFALAFLLSIVPVAPASADLQLPPGCTLVGQSAPFTLVCLPSGTWNHDLVVFAHGYVAPGAQNPVDPTTTGFSQLVVDGQFLPSLLTSAGYAFVASSYRHNGLAVLEGLDDTLAAIAAFRAQYPSTDQVFLVGASEGALVTALAVERHPEALAGGLAVCGPVGDFRAQINYLGDFRVIFDYFFDGVLPGSAVDVPASIAANWYAPDGYANAVGTAIAGNPTGTSQLYSVTRAAIDPAVPSTVVQTALSVLWYSAFATMQAQEELNGQPFDNRTRLYVGSANDRLLNRLVERYRAGRSAIVALQQYQTSGQLQKALVTMHTTLDPVVPYAQEPIYTLKTIAAGSATRHVNIPVIRYGHCAFTSGEMLGGFAVMQFMTGIQSTSELRAALPNAKARDDFDRVIKEHGGSKPK